MSDLSWNIWGAVSAAIGLLCPSLWTWIKSHFLPAKLEALEKLTMEVAKLLTLARRHGLLVDDGEYCLFNSKLWHAQERLDKAGAMVAAHPGVINNLKGLWSDLSRQVSLMIDDINSVKVQLLLRTSKERKKLASSGNIADIPDYADFEGDSNIPPTSPSIATASLPAMTAPQPTLDSISVQENTMSRSPAGVTSSNRPGSSLPHPPHRPLFGDELQDLFLSLVLTHPLLREEGRKRERVKRRETLVDHGRQLCASPDLIPVAGVGPPSSKWRPTAYDAHVKALKRLLRRTYGFRRPTRTDSGVALLDPESLLSVLDDDGDSSWLDQ